MNTSSTRPWGSAQGRREVHGGRGSGARSWSVDSRVYYNQSIYDVYTAPSARMAPGQQAEGERCQFD